eukprot:m.190363 g.190363  ORF g.190363 m.190363 type:complete len:218 (-) comp18556_c0_seq9:123-776(-)
MGLRSVPNLANLFWRAGNRGPYCFQDAKCFSILPVRNSITRCGSENIVQRSLTITRVQPHDHSKGVIGRDDGEAERRGVDTSEWWEQRPPVPDDAPEVRIKVMMASGESSVEIIGRVGESVEDVAKREGLVEGACDGNCQCSTCHVFVVNEEDRRKLGMPQEIEEFEIDMLELARDYDADPDASRLSCQIILTEELEGLVVKLPRFTTNYMDDIPFE